MSAKFSNVYDDPQRASAYATLEFPGTYSLAFRDLPAILRAHARGTRALDFGCGAGRSTRFLRDLGFEVVGVDIAQHMIERARERDPQGDYRLIQDDDFRGFEPAAHDVVLSAFTFDNIPTMDEKVGWMRALADLLKPGGRIVNLVSAPEIYVNEWVSFSTRDFPENRNARCGETVRIVMLDVADRRPVEDILWTDEAWQEVHRRAGVAPLEVHRPLGKETEPVRWASETTIAPWVIYVLSAADEEPVEAWW